jgi:hypothetical protein
LHPTEYEARTFLGGGEGGRRWFGLVLSWSWGAGVPGGTWRRTKVASIMASRVQVNARYYLSPSSIFDMIMRGVSSGTLPLASNLAFRILLHSIFQLESIARIGLCTSLPHNVKTLGKSVPRNLRLQSSKPSKTSPEEGGKR